MKAYKGFNKDMTCRGFQYEEGKIYEEDKAKLCNSGFHACLNPLDCFSYYSPADSVFYEVELDDVSDERQDDSKVCAKKIKIGAALDVAKICKLHFEYVKEHCDPSKSEHATGDYSAASNTGNCSAASVSGKGSVALVVGYGSRAKASLDSAIVICERGEWNGSEYPLIGIKSAIVDGKTIKADTWYRLVNGEFVEVENEEQG